MWPGIVTQTKLTHREVTAMKTPSGIKNIKPGARLGRRLAVAGFVAGLMYAHPEAQRFLLKISL
ncbi:MAG TPA: hypothetical protein VJ302_10895 [Blastocatellia bacterium]|nr:hypothetical protein [Blastocatellia bacterium]